MVQTLINCILCNIQKSHYPQQHIFNTLQPYEKLLCSHFHSLLQCTYLALCLQVTLVAHQ